MEARALIDRGSCFGNGIIQTIESREGSKLGRSLLKRHGRMDFAYRTGEIENILIGEVGHNYWN